MYEYDIFPIVGEYTHVDGKLAVSVMSIACETNIIVRVVIGTLVRNYPIRLSQNTFTRCIVDTGVVNCVDNTCVPNDIKLEFIQTNRSNIELFIHPSIYLKVAAETYQTFNVFNCDCQTVPNVRMWEKVPESETTTCSFHLGDTVYFDNIYLELCKRPLRNMSQEALERKTRKMMFSEYSVGFQRKKHILQQSFNVILLDDHDICDDSFLMRNYNTNSKRVLATMKMIAIEFQHSLRVSSSPHIKFGKTSIVLIDNVNTLEVPEYNKNVLSILAHHKSEIAPLNLFLLSARKLLYYNPQKKSCMSTTVSRCIAEKQCVDDVNFEKILDALLELQVTNRFVMIGDHHSYSKLELQKCPVDADSTAKSDTILYMNVGTMNSVLMNEPPPETPTNYSMKLHYAASNLHSYVHIDQLCDTTSARAEHVFERDYGKVVTTIFRTIATTVFAYKSAIALYVPRFW